MRINDNIRQVSAYWKQFYACLSNWVKCPTFSQMLLGFNPLIFAGSLFIIYGSYYRSLDVTSIVAYIFRVNNMPLAYTWGYYNNIKASDAILRLVGCARVDFYGFSLGCYHC